MPTTSSALVSPSAPPSKDIAASRGGSVMASTLPQSDSGPTSTARSSSKGRRRSTLSSLFRSATQDNAESPNIATADSTDTSAASATAWRRSVDLGRSTGSASSSAPKSKPPVSLPGLFRRRRSSSRQRDDSAADAQITSTSRRTSIDDGPSFSARRRSSVDSGDVRERSLSSSSSRIYQGAGTRADSGGTTSTQSGRSPPSAITSPGSSRVCSRGSLASPDDNEHAVDDDEEDISSGSGEEDIQDFVRASAGRYRASSQTSPASPFHTQFDRFTAGSSTSLEHSTSSSPPPAGDSPLIRRLSRAQSPPPIQARRLTGNSLSISDLPRNSPPLSTSALPPPTVPETSAAAPIASTSTAGPSSAAAEAAPTATAQRMRTLPRLLSGDAYSFAAMRSSSSSSGVAGSTVPEGRESEDAEESTETETETDGESEEEHEDEDGSSRVMSAEAMMVPESRPTPRPSAATPGAGSFFGAAGTSAQVARTPAGWITFEGVTPTPGPLRTARIGSGTTTPSESYFDIRRAPSAPGTPRTAAQPPMTPLLPQSLSKAARGQRPTRQDELQEAEQQRQATTSPSQDTSDNAGRNFSPIRTEGLNSGMYRRRSASAVAILSPSLLDDDDQPLGTAALAGLDPVWQTGGLSTPGPSFLSQTPIPATPKDEQPPTAPRTPGAQGTLGSPVGSRLHRRRSMYELPTAPPAYHAVYKRPAGPAQVVYPREEEGVEGLPDYTCAVHLEGYMPRKMEFTAPSVQARDRSWKRVYVVLHGTSIKFYKHDLRTHPIAGEQDFSTATTEMAGKDGPPPLHFHPGEYGVEETTPSTSKFPVSVADARAKAKSKLVQATTASDANVLLRHYSLQNAESGLAADYIKRKHVVRVRAEGEQFLLQTTGDRGTIDLIEVLQAATNVALDLDARPLPKFITLPRRRRRRRRVDPNAPAGANGAAAATASATTSPTGTASASRSSRSSSAVPDDRMADMLAEEQNAYAGSSTNASTV